MNRLAPLIALGVVVGVLLGILLAPYVGVGTRATTITLATTITKPEPYYVTQTIISHIVTTTTATTEVRTTTTATLPITITLKETATQIVASEGSLIPAEQKLFEFVLPWNDTATSSFDLSKYLHKPAGRYGHVYVGPDGHLYVGDQRIKFLGVSIVASSAFSPPSVVDEFVERLAKYGINLIRLHALDAHWTSRNIFEIGTTRKLDSERLSRLDYLIYKLKENGIYVNINLMCYRSYTSADGLPKEADNMQVKDKHLLPFFYEPAKELVKEFSKQLLTHVNPYTGLSYAEDPAVAFIEILNEYGMLFGWLDGAVDRLPSIFKAELQKKWNEYLRQKYVITENLRKAWGALNPDENLEQGTVRIFTSSEYRARSVAAQKDWVEFLWRLEYNFFIEMYKYLKEELKVKALVVGTQVVFGGTPNIQQLLDLIDTHHYWRYPVGSGSDFYVVNDAMVNSPTGNTIISIAYRRVYGKPFMISEYNHPAPNMYRSEAMIFLPAFGAYQDWDAIVFYSYGDAGGSFVFNSMRMRSTLDIDQDPARWALMVTAYMMFMRGDVQPAKQWVAVDFPKDLEIELVRNGRASVWNLPHGTMVSPEYIPLLRGVGLVTSNRTKPTNAVAPANVVAPREQLYVSDTGEIIWDCKEIDRCVFIVNTSRSKVVTGFIGGRKIDLGNVFIEVKSTLLNGWATIALHVLEGEDFANAKKVLVIAIGSVFNTNMMIYEYTSRSLL
ncbi:MAG: hypothetical protein QW162_02285, partial [Ignisphaera sp.]